MFNPESISLLSKLAPELAVIVAITSLAAWSLRGLLRKPQPVQPAASPAPAPRQRSTNQSAALEKAKATQRSLKNDLEALQATSVSKATYDAAISGQEAARKSLDTELKRTAALEAELKKSQDTIKSLNNRANEGDKARKDREIALENELSKVRGQLALLQATPDDTAGLQAEIERLRESVAVTTRFAGEVRKREAIALESLARAQAQLDNRTTAALAGPAAPKQMVPRQESEKVVAAKAEVARLNSLRESELLIASTEAVQEPLPEKSEPANLEAALAETN